jgi:hypothetical protein
LLSVHFLHFDSKEFGGDARRNLSWWDAGLGALVQYKAFAGFAVEALLSASYVLDPAKVNGSVLDGLQLPDYPISGSGRGDPSRLGFEFALRVNYDLSNMLSSPSQHAAAGSLQRQYW